METRGIIFKNFYLRHFKALGNFCYVYLKDENLALDIVQETFFRLYQHWSSDYSEHNAEAFIYITAKNLCLDYLRRLKFKIEDVEPLKEQIASEQFFLEEIIRQETIAKIRMAVDALKGRNHEVVLLTLQGKTNPEIADMLGITVNTVKFLKKEAYQKLRKFLSQEYLPFMALLLN